MNTLANTSFSQASKKCTIKCDRNAIHSPIQPPQYVGCRSQDSSVLYKTY